jgi:hypothetical protein
MAPLRFRFRPARPATAAAAALLGGGLLVTGLVAGAWGWAAAGALPLALALLYFRSPAWRTEVRVDDDALEVFMRGIRRFRLPWPEVAGVVASPATRTAFVDGGAPERSLLLPGRGARAPYRIEHQPELYDAILAHVAPERVTEVERLASAYRSSG